MTRSVRATCEGCTGVNSFPSKYIHDLGCGRLQWHHCCSASLVHQSVGRIAVPGLFLFDRFRVAAHAIHVACFQHWLNSVVNACLRALCFASQRLMTMKTQSVISMHQAVIEAIRVVRVVTLLGSRNKRWLRHSNSLARLVSCAKCIPVFSASRRAADTLL